MTKFIKFICAAFLVCTLFTFVSAAPPEIISETAVLIDADTGQVLYDKGMHNRMYPASITKILTVITGLENLPMDARITMSHDAVFAIPYGSSHIALDEGEEISMEQAVYAALLMSANDACNGIAETVSGSNEEFAVLMNETAMRAGAKNSNFVNPHGLHKEEHYTTAYDMAMICRYAIANPTFREVFGTRKYTMAPTNEQEEERLFINQHYMISDSSMKYEGIIGGKTGFTSTAKCTLVTAAERDGRTLIAVVMKCVMDADKYSDTRALLDYGFDEFTMRTVHRDDIPEKLSCEIDGDFTVLVPDVRESDELSFDVTEAEEGAFLSVSYAEGNEHIIDVPCTIITEPEPVALPVQKKDDFPMWGVVLIVLATPLILFGLFLLGIIVRKKAHKIIKKIKKRRNQK